MAIRNVVTRGFGAGATIPFVVTRGYTLGGVVAVTAVAPSGGWRFLTLFERELEERSRERELREQRETETLKIDDQVDRDIALLFRAQEAKDDRREELDRLSRLVKANADLERAKEQGERVEKAFKRAVEKGNFSALEALDRELKRVREEEEFMMFSMMLLLDEVC